MPVARLTDLSVQRLQPPERGQTIYLDQNLKGFGVRVTENGAKSYVLTYTKQRKRITLGKVGIIGLAQARQKAKNVLADYQLHGEAEASLPFSEALERFITLHCATKNRASTAKETKRLLE
ncbi:MAG: Arm DNA-binding domain-containing protein, partial [Alphaproteobacteria bacterium]